MAAGANGKVDMSVLTPVLNEEEHMTVATREVIQDGIADPKNDNAVVKAFVLTRSAFWKARA